MKNRIFSTVAIALATGLVGLGVGTAVSNAQDKKPDPHDAHHAHGAAATPATHAAGGQDPHAYEETMQQHVAMFRGPEGAARAKQVMMMMAAHQYLLGDMADNDDVKKIAASPEMKAAIAEVKAAFKDHATRDRKKNDVANKGDEAMMIIAHALLNQDEEAAQMLKAAATGD